MMQNNKQYFNSRDKLMIMTAESCGNADTHVLQTQAGLSCWTLAQ